MLILIISQALEQVWWRADLHPYNLSTSLHPRNPLHRDGDTVGEAYHPSYSSSSPKFHRIFAAVGEDEVGETDQDDDDLTPLCSILQNNLSALEMDLTNHTLAPEVTPPEAGNKEHSGKVNSLVRQAEGKDLLLLSSTLTHLAMTAGQSTTLASAVKRVVAMVQAVYAEIFLMASEAASTLRCRDEKKS